MESEVMKIALGADSAGKPLLDVIEAHLKTKSGLEVTNLSKQGFYAEVSDGVGSAILGGNTTVASCAAAPASASASRPTRCRGSARRSPTTPIPPTAPRSPTTPRSSPWAPG
jgi:hypothetical protein